MVLGLAHLLVSLAFFLSFYVSFVFSVGLRWFLLGLCSFGDALFNLAPMPMLDSVKEHFSHLIIGLVVSKRMFPKAVVLRALKQDWVCEGIWLVEELPGYRTNAFLVSFELEEDKQMVLERRSWSVFGELFVLSD